MTTSVILKLIFNPTHNQRVAGSCPAGPTFNIKHLQNKIVSVFYFTLGLRQDLGENGEF